MTDEIIKLYENAGINKNCHANIKFDDCIYSPSDCGHYNYPEFTSEKQIAILCWLVNLKGSVALNNKPKDITPERLQEVLAWAVNRYWTELTPEEKQQVKGILE